VERLAVLYNGVCCDKTFAEERRQSVTGAVSRRVEIIVLRRADVCLIRRSRGYRVDEAYYYDFSLSQQTAAYHLWPVYLSTRKRYKHPVFSYYYFTTW